MSERSPETGALFKQHLRWLEVGGIALTAKPPDPANAAEAAKPRRPAVSARGRLLLAFILSHNRVDYVPGQPWQGAEFTAAELAAELGCTDRQVRRIAARLEEAQIRLPNQVSETLRILWRDHPRMGLSGITGDREPTRVSTRRQEQSAVYRVCTEGLERLCKIGEGWRKVAQEYLRTGVRPVKGEPMPELDGSPPPKVSPPPAPPELPELRNERAAWVSDYALRSLSAVADDEAARTAATWSPPDRSTSQRVLQTITGRSRELAGVSVPGCPVGLRLRDVADGLSHAATRWKRGERPAPPAAEVRTWIPPDQGGGVAAWPVRVDQVLDPLVRHYLDGGLEPTRLADGVLWLRGSSALVNTLGRPQVSALVEALGGRIGFEVVG